MGFYKSIYSSRFGNHLIQAYLEDGCVFVDADGRVYGDLSSVRQAISDNRRLKVHRRGQQRERPRASWRENGRRGLVDSFFQAVIDALMNR